MYPLLSPIGLLFYTRHCFYGIKEIVFFITIFNISIDQKTIHFRMNVFNGHLKSVETSSLGNLYFCTKSFRQIFIHYSVTGCKKRQYMFYKIFFVWC
ncbi:putative F ORF C [Vaccinia virus Copenhagen]|uniref:Uncharacterized 11.6 kDa protein n=3 Tax=Vaccinia virus TaxID=10245 RepID=YVFC_VACCC|nr:RecName: Full=Uncharacterized 11.6 kDa protein [Vaccinia virus Copenhagen]AAF33895.1 unknown [Vaccinia virus Tian Tan]AGJ91197.1 hypothetical protein VACV_TT8_051 [Vaccinia virus]AAA48020.1 putative F ORF C [Vaccinia virus Copenhagen]AGJ91470.1 hypothetical protein VACV_TT9_051 [Vaccinia virus]WDR17166.1 putative F ORF C [Vaccinia virus Copenhagen]